MGKKEAGGSRMRGEGEEGSRRRVRRKWGRWRLEEAGCGGKVKNEVEGGQ
jgi:hypothetical protein